jgi:hypothetical protein
MARISRGGNNESASVYSQIIERIFFERYSPGMESVEFSRDDLLSTAQELGVSPPKNLGDVVYSFKYRNLLPASIVQTAPEQKEWVLRTCGQGRYAFQLSAISWIIPRQHLRKIKIPDATPKIVRMYSFDDEQSLLARIRYNRLIDVFTGITCYSLQNHLRTTVEGIGQIETDEIYVGVDKRGAHYVFPVQAKGGTDMMSVVQIEQDFAMCQERFPELICIPIGAQFMSEDEIAMFAFTQSDDGEVTIWDERHYILTPENIEQEELDSYKNMPLNTI